ncbi:MAG: hypothetical protein WC775_05505 [Patescibacteria group bacterium]|jgi:DNA-binding GntR family transcriptional regulator
MNETPDAKQILLQILEIIGYGENREAFAADFMNLCAQEAMADMIDKLTDEQIEAIQQKLAGSQSVEDTRAALAEFYTGDDYMKALAASCNKSLTEFITTVLPTLSPEQGKKLSEYVVKFAPAATA